MSFGKHHRTHLVFKRHLNRLHLDQIIPHLRTKKVSLPKPLLNTIIRPHYVPIPLNHLPIVPIQATDLSSRILRLLHRISRFISDNHLRLQQVQSLRLRENPDANGMSNNCCFFSLNRCLLCPSFATSSTDAIE